MLVLACLGLVALAVGAQVQQRGSGYHLIKTVKLGGVGGWDYLAIDPRGPTPIHFVPIRSHGL